MFNNAVVTAKGLALDTKVRAGETVARFTKVALGDGAYTGLEDLESATQLKNLKQVFGISSKTIYAERSVMFRIVTNNSGVPEGYNITEMGLFADDPDDGEILYSIALGVEGKMDYQPSETELPEATGTFDFYTAISNAKEAIFKLGTGAAASSEDLLRKADIEGGDAANMVVSEIAESTEESPVIQNGDSFKVIIGKFIKLFTEKVDVSGGDISDTVVSSIDTITTEFPVPIAGESSKTFLGKVKKFIEDFNAFKSGILTVGMLVNNAVTNNSGLPVSAAVAYALQNQLTQLNSDKAAVEHIHDERYYTEAEVEARLVSKSDTSHIHNAIRIYDDTAR
ncbi:MAG: hypothetical protein ACRDBO_11375, partial [Lachnospiraceae bacterium]